VRQPIKLKRDQYLGEGAFAKVYRVSPRRVVKVYDHRFTKKEIKDLMEDEIKGSKSVRNALPVLRVVDVIPPGCTKRVQKGLLKRYIPLEVSHKEFREYVKSWKELDWDAHDSNYRKDTRGNYWQVDTQTENCYECYEDSW
jgi:hypothetical protein